MQEVKIGIGLTIMSLNYELGATAARLLSHFLPQEFLQQALFSIRLRLWQANTGLVYGEAISSPNLFLVPASFVS